MTNRTARLLVSSALGLALAGSGSAFAQDPPPAEGTTPPAGGEATPPPPAAAPAASSGGATDVTLRQGGIGIDGDLVIGLSKDNAGKPIQIVPNLYYGVSDVLTVGLAHNTGSEIFQAVNVPGGRGLCLSGESDGCRKVYNNVAADVLFSFMRSSTMDLAAHGGLDIAAFDPTVLQLRLGVKGKTMAGPLVIVFDPAFYIGLTERDGNKEAINLPVRLGFMATPQLNLGLSAAIGGQLDGFGDNYSVPLGLGGTFALNSQLDLRAQFAFNELGSASTRLGGIGRADIRTLSVGAVFKM
jgi:hypothetical protein